MDSEHRSFWNQCLIIDAVFCQRLPKNSLHSQSLQHPSGLLTAALLHIQVHISFGKCGSDTEITAGANAAGRCKRAAYETTVERSDYSHGPTQGLPRSVKFSDTTRLNVDRWKRWLTIRGNQEGVALLFCRAWVLPQEKLQSQRRPFSEWIMQLDETAALWRDTQRGTSPAFTVNPALL